MGVPAMFSHESTGRMPVPLPPAGGQEDAAVGVGLDDGAETTGLLIAAPLGGIR
jgi:hypothetical protein